MGLIKSLLQVLRPPTPLTALMISKSLSGLSRNDFQASLEEGGEDGVKKRGLNKCLCYSGASLL